MPTQARKAGMMFVRMVTGMPTAAIIPMVHSDESATTAMLATTLDTRRNSTNKMPDISRKLATISRCMSVSRMWLRWAFTSGRPVTRA